MPPIANPFPGMNPFLEGFWPDMHTRLMVYLSNALQTQLPDGLFARVEESLTINAEEEDRVRNFRADVLVAHTWGDDFGGESGGGGAALVEPDVYRVLEMANPRRVEIIDVRGGGEVITVIEVLSPTNKGDGREFYFEKSLHLRRAGVNLVEIDLLREGTHTVAIPLQEIPAQKRTPYLVCASRGAQPGLFSVWHIALLQRLPAIAIPLRPADRDAVVDLQPLIDSAYHDGRYDRLIDYRKPLTPPLPPDALARVDEYLSSRGAART